MFSKFNLGLIRYIVFKNNENLRDSKYKKTVIVPAKNELEILKIIEEFTKQFRSNYIFSRSASDNTEDVIRTHR